MSQSRTKHPASLIAESQDRRNAAFATIKEGYHPPMSADDHRNKANEHDKRADELLSGEKKDSNLIAAKSHRAAATAIDQANRSSAKAEAL